MRRNNISIIQWVAWLCITLTACSGIEDELSSAIQTNESGSDTRANLIEYTIHVETAGTLGSLIKAGNYSNAQKLIVTGKIAHEDVSYVDKDMTSVEVLDLSGAEYNDTYTNNEFLSESTNIKEISLPGNITSISYYAFKGCNSLTSIHLPESVRRFDLGAFMECSSLTSINIPEGVTSIGNSAFWNCSSLANITLPESMTEISSNAFYGCSSLTSIHIPEGVTSIGHVAFYGCSSLTSITIPQGVTSIGNYAFEGCSSLTSITIPEGVTSIGNCAFQDCSSLTSIHIPDGVTSIGGGAFDGCSYLTSISIPEGVTSIENYTFEDCSSLTSITIPEGVTSIGDFAFYDCGSLTSITLPEGVTSIGDYAFSRCKSLISATISEGVTSIGNQFSGCSSLTNISIPKSVTSIESEAFADCTSIKIIKWNTSCSLTDYFSSLLEKLIIYGAKDSTSTAGYDITTAQQAIYTKTYSTDGFYNRWYTISLPFEPDQITHEEKGAIAPFDSGIEGAKNFWLRELTQDGYQDVTKIEACHAYIIAMPTDYNYTSDFRLGGTVTFSAEDVTLTWEPVVSEGPTYSIYPTYETIETSMDVYSLNSEYFVDGYDYGHVFVRGARDVVPFEAYVKLNDGAATMRSVLPMTDGKRTAVRGASSSNDANTRVAYGQQKPKKEDM